MQRFNKYLRGLRDEIIDEKLSQKQYRLLKFQKLIGIIIISTFGITSESFDDNNNEDVLIEAKLLLDQKQHESSIKK
ncbi:unnamed protein product [Paramecium sonneborni]|uniref:Uncharacterized protein n=1 Tax=Paramecium sonneborni TaxID=65129 RepID=A0A8S1MF45_9CILI|nr:unnamed protein product [Paramecium sonneborni]